MTTPSPASYQGKPSVRERARTLLDRVISPDVRRAAYTSIRTFAHDQPLLAGIPARSGPETERIETNRAFNSLSPRLVRSVLVRTKGTSVRRNLKNISLPPILLFASFVLGVALLAALAAVAFTLFWTGLALL
ncbi:hypothetical protein V491_02398, partial [Pseudogymnoascus sp. VKM F-3775]